MDARTREIKNALLILFEHKMLLSYYANNPIKTHNIKKAFRRKAKYFHPDKSKVFGINERELTSKFQIINEAYNLLLDLLDQKDKIIVRIISKSSTDNYTQDFSILKRFYNGNLPKRKLRFAEFLFYSKVINFHSMIKAIVWQRKNRPIVGKLGVQLGYMTQNDIRFIIRNRQYSEQFGQTAARLGLISPYQLRVILRKQKKFKCLIGEYFTNEKIITHFEIGRLLYEHRKHNFSLSRM
ncbi:MAG: DnaJ domain-containing protein [Candidatus Cloacimonadota bacterium]|nr:DnaJ domain-containing protein [Candidatus Cloacimonadota bacterium]